MTVGRDEVRFVTNIAGLAKAPVQGELRGLLLVFLQHHQNTGYPFKARASPGVLDQLPTPSFPNMDLGLALTQGQV